MQGWRAFIFRLLWAWLIFNTAQAVAAPSYKRGLANGQMQEADLALASGHIAWWYNWSVAPGRAATGATPPKDVAFVPMAWGRRFDEKALGQYLRLHPKTRYLLGFNEPNFANQANLSPAAAAKAWQRLQPLASAFGVKLVAPAVNFSPGPYHNPFKYLDAFFKACQGCRVDAIAVHSYMASPRAFERYVSAFYRRYGKPVWVTEWAFAKKRGQATLNEQLDYLAETCRWLEQSDFVESYAWFAGRSKSGPSAPPFRDLLAGPGQWTPLGLLYSAIPAKGERLAVPGTFLAINASTIHGVSHWVINNKEPAVALRAKGTGSYFSFDLHVNDPGQYRLAGDYVVVQSAKVKVYLDGKEIGPLNLKAGEKTTDWQMTQLPFSLTAGNHQIKITVERGSPSFHRFQVNKLK